jgi:cation/acetate symporter
MHNGISNWFHLVTSEDGLFLDEMLTISTDESGNSLFNGAPKSERMFYQVGHLSTIVSDGEEVEKTGRTNPFSFLTKIEDSEVVRYYKTLFDFEGASITGWYPVITSGKDIMKPGLLYKLEGASIWEKLNFVSLMLALFLGTSALPHILIRYYTVPSQRDARKSTIIAITAIGFFYILTLYMGLGAMINGVLDMESSNMSGPLLAKSFGLTLFAVISAVAFATVLGTVSGLIVASSGAIAHDLMDKYFKVNMEDNEKVLAGKLSAFGVGIFAIILGILLKGMNVSFLVGLAFAVAASANLPAILMILFWDKTTSNGVSSSIIVGILSSVILILFSPSMFERYGLPPESAWFPMDNPGIVSIPLSFMTLIMISLYSQKNSIGTINKNNALSK